MKGRAGEYLGRNLFATSFNDAPVASLVERRGADRWMRSNDFPHPNFTFTRFPAMRTAAENTVPTGAFP